MQQLESLTYEAKPIQIQRQVVYGVGDLESLSATALYYGSKGSPLGSLGSFGIVKTPLMKIETLKIGMTLPGGLKIKDLTKNSAVIQEDFGGVGNIYTAHPDGSGSTRFYGLGKGKKKETKSIWDTEKTEE